MCAGDDKTCPEFELHHSKFKERLDRERRSFLKSSFAAAGGAAALSAGAGVALKIDILRWSTDEEAAKLVATYKESGDKGWSEALRAAPSVGYVWAATSSLGGNPVPGRAVDGFTHRYSWFLRISAWIQTMAPALPTVSSRCDAGAAHGCVETPSPLRSQAASCFSPPAIRAGQICVLASCAPGVLDWQR